MIRFDSIRVIDFALFPDLTLEFSTDPNRPLTLLRGENESGKTTLMRAFVWVMFGTLPRIPDTRHPVRPVWARPQEEVRTVVEIRFRVAGERGVTHFRLRRVVDTMDDGTTVTQGQERVSLYRRDGDDWHEQDDELPILRKRFFRLDMRDFYFIDADKALEFVGGPEGKHSDELMRETVTQAIRALLGLDRMRQATERLEERHISYSRNAGSRSSNVEQQRLANELDEIQAKLGTMKDRLSQLVAEERDRDQTFREIEQEFDERLSKLAEIDETNRQYEDVRRNVSEARLRKNELINELVQRLDDERLYAALMLPVIDDVMRRLQPLKDKGYIPPSELTLLPRLLERGMCVCGANLSIGSASRKQIEKQVENAEVTRGQSEFLDAALECARSFGNRAMGHSEPSWREDIEAVEQELSKLEPRLSSLMEQQDALREARERAGTGNAMRELKKHRDELRVSLDTTREQRKAAQDEVADLQGRARSLSERIRTAATAEKRTQVDRNSADVADDLRVIVAEAYDAIEQQQVGEVSRTMNRIFRDAITATADSLFSEAGIRAIAKERLVKQYELYTLEDDREKPLALANGASRRVIGVAFVLALAEGTRTMVPLVADSLLHAMSGSVKQKIVDYLTAGDRVGQPVLFGTRSDFMDKEVSVLLKSRVGRSYTLTSQSHAGGDVVRATPTATRARQVVVCDCGIDEFCPVCERAGDQARASEGRLTARPHSRVLS
jgi:DNA sulfur modification protein DndD